MDKKSENFVRLAENRTNKILDTLRLLGNLSNTANYTYTDAQVEAIFKSIQKELDTQHRQFKKQETKVKKFRL